MQLPAEEFARSARTSSAVMKEGSIETLRGLAVVLMVMGHVIGDDGTGGLCVADDSVYRHIYESFRLVRMPLFTAISGFVYALRPLGSPAGWPKFLGGKARRLLLPMATVGSVEFLAHAMVPSINRPAELRDIWRIYFFGYDHYWFLQAIFVVIVVVAAGDAFGLLQKRAHWALALLVSCAAWQLLPKTTFFSLNGALYLAQFFLLGVAVKRFEGLPNRWLLALCWLTFLVGISCQQLAWYGRIQPLVRTGVLEVVTSLSAMMVLLHHRRLVPGLARLGGAAYTIYLFHTFGVAPARMLVERLAGRSDQAVLVAFTASLLAGLTVPSLIDRFLRNHAVTAFLFLGLRVSPKNKSVPAAC
jgi:glucans biosynthesis protein C